MEKRQIELYVKHDERIHDVISGNKWRKLKFNVERMRAMKKEGILTFGGAYSNHLLACAKAGQLLGFKTLGFVRGEELNSQSNEVLQTCASWGMELVFVSREEYKMRYDKDYLTNVKAKFSQYYLVPEGGANELGMLGCQELWSELDQAYDQLWLAVGTGTTAAGLLFGKPENTEVHAVPVLKGFDLKLTLDQYPQLLMSSEEWQELMGKHVVHAEFHFGGYAKTSSELQRFISSVEKESHLKLDHVYTGKAFYALCNQIQKSTLTNAKVLFLHTGGIFFSE